MNEEQTPRSLALHFETGPESGNTNHGIYELDGDHWRILLNMTGGPAPAEFRTAPGSGDALETLIRAVSKPPLAIDQADRQPVPELQGLWAMISCVRGGEALPPELVRSAKRSIAGIQSTLYFGRQMFMQGVLSKDGAAPAR